jgi:hypothetical protein
MANQKLEFVSMSCTILNSVGNDLIILLASQLGPTDFQNDMNLCRAAGLWQA